MGALQSYERHRNRLISSSAWPSAATGPDRTNDCEVTMVMAAAGAISMFR
jgi:hypothetical protein